MSPQIGPSDTSAKCSPLLVLLPLWCNPSFLRAGRKVGYWLVFTAASDPRGVGGVLLWALCPERLSCVLRGYRVSVMGVFRSDLEEF